jgi:choline kinase
LDEARYPTPSEQRTFIKAYVEHRSAHHHSGSNSGSRSLGSISTYTLDARGPPSQAVEDEDKRNEEIEGEIERLIQDARLWRAANSAQWVAWGIVQAHIPGISNDLQTTLRDGPEQGVPSQISTTPVPIGTKAALTKSPEEEDPNLNLGDEDEFDYLGYAQERAMFFWGDLLNLGLISTHELPSQLLPKLKMLKY